MSGPQIKGWCPGLLQPMRSGDGLVVRLRPFGGRLTAEQALGVAEAAQRFGNGLIDLSSRANIQLRGVSDETLAPLTEALRALGLVDGDIASETRRNIVVTPFWQDGDGTETISAALALALAAPDAPQLPGKFGFAVDSGPKGGCVLRETSADIRIERGLDWLLVRAEGSPTGAPVAPDEVAQAVMELAHWFIDTGGVKDGRGRMSRHLTPAMMRRLPARFQSAGAYPSHAARAQVGPNAAGFLVGFEFGQFHASTLSALAELGPLRATPWRMLLLEGARNAPDLPDLITDPADPRLCVIACTGAPGCPQALGPARELARQLTPLLAPSARLHLSGCTKGCAHPAACATTLVATARGYDLIRSGTASSAPVLQGLTGVEILARPDLLHPLDTKAP